MAAQRTIQRQRHDIDATGVSLGRLASRVAVLLRGKHKPTYAPNIDAGDAVHITNVRFVRFTGRKPTRKVYHRFTGFPSGVRSTSLRIRWERDPAAVVRDAVYGMLPSNRLRARMIKRLSSD